MDIQSGSSDYHFPKDLDQSDEIRDAVGPSKASSPEKINSEGMQSVRDKISMSKKSQAERRDIPKLPLSQMNIPVHSRSAEGIALRRSEDTFLSHEEELQAKLKNAESEGLSKQDGTAQSKSVRKKEGKVETVAKQIPFGIGFAVESYMEHKEASACRAEAKEIEHSIKNDSLSKKEIKGIKREIREKKAEVRALQKQILELDKTMADDYNKLREEGGLLNVNRVGSQVDERENLEHAIKSLNNQIQSTRRKLYSADISAPELDSKIGQMDQKVSEQKQHERKGYSFGVRAGTLGGYNVLTVGKLVSVAADIAVASSALTPITAVVGLTAGGIGAAIHTDGLIDAKKALNRLGNIEKEGQASEVRAWYEQGIALNSKEPQTQELSNVKSQVELEKANYIKDFVHLNRKKIHREVVSNSLALAESTALVGACTCSLMTMIPEPTTATTMFAGTISFTAAKYVLMVSEWGYEIGGEVLEERHEKKLHSKPDFGVDESPAYKGISKSQLGLDIRLANMIKLGIAPPSILKYHDIIDEKGFVEFITQLTQELGKRQERKKELTVISDYSKHVETHFAKLAEQLEQTKPPEQNAA